VVGDACDERGCRVWRSVFIGNRGFGTCPQPIAVGGVDGDEAAFVAIGANDGGPYEYGVLLPKQKTERPRSRHATGLQPRAMGPMGVCSPSWIMTDSVRWPLT